MRPPWPRSDLYLLFAAGFYHQPLSSAQEATLPALTLLSCVGSPSSTVNAVDFLGNWLGFPAGSSSLYVQTMVVTRYGQVVVSVMAFALLTLLPLCAYTGKLRWKPRKLAWAVVVPLLLTAFGGWAAGALERSLAPTRPAPWKSLSVDPALRAKVPTKVLKAPATAISGSESSLARVRREGLLRVGYSPTVIPFCYLNEEQELVGFDVAMAHHLAADLGVRLELVPLSWDTLQADLQTGRFDVAMAGLYVTSDRLRTLGVSSPYFHSPWAFLVATDSVPQLRRAQDAAKLTLTIFEDDVLSARVAEMFPQAHPRVVSDYRQLPSLSDKGAALWTLQQASAFAAAHPGFTAVRPSGLGEPVMFAYMSAHKDEFLTFLNYWMLQKELDGVSQREREYWLEGKPRKLLP